MSALGELQRLYDEEALNSGDRERALHLAIDHGNAQCADAVRRCDVTAATNWAAATLSFSMRHTGERADRRG